MKKIITPVLIGGLMVSSLVSPAFATAVSDNDDNLLISPSPETSEIQNTSGNNSDKVVEDENSETNAVVDYEVLRCHADDIIKDEETGKITGVIVVDEDGNKTILNISDKTFCIDNKTRTSFDINELISNEPILVYRSAVQTFSLPPQTAAYVIVRNYSDEEIMGYPKYSKVESEVETNDDVSKFLTEFGGMYIGINEDTKLLKSDGSEASIKDLTPGTRILNWYGVAALSYPGQALSEQIIIMPEIEAEEAEDVGEIEEPIIEAKEITRGDFVDMLYKAAGSPAVDSMDLGYMDIDGSSDKYNAIIWAATNGFMSGYGNGTFGVNDKINAEQAYTVIWRYNGAPEADLSNISKCDDFGSVSDFAKEALAWMDSLKLINTDSNKLNSKDVVTNVQINEILNNLSQDKS